MRFRLKHSHKLEGILHCNKEIINVSANILIEVTSISEPNIRISKGAFEAKGLECFREGFMEPCTRRAKAVESLADDHPMASQRAKLRTSLEADFLLGVGFKVSIANISSTEFQVIQFS